MSSISRAWIRAIFDFKTGFHSGRGKKLVDEFCRPAEIKAVSNPVSTNDNLSFIHDCARGIVFLFFSFLFLVPFTGLFYWFGTEERDNFERSPIVERECNYYFRCVVYTTSRQQCRALAYLFAPETWLMLILSPTYSQSNDNHRVNGHSRDILLTIFDFLLSSRKFQTRDSERANDHSDRLGSFFILPLYCGGSADKIVARGRGVVNALVDTANVRRTSFLKGGNKAR